MLKFALLGALLISTSALSVGCKKKPRPLKPGELSEKDKTELRTKAIAHYERIAKDYPDHAHAEDAKKRAQALKAEQKKK
jgi:hypothetical protein